MIYLNTNTESIDIDGALERVSAQRRSLALGYVKDSDRRQSLAAYLLLMDALEKEYGITEPPEFGFGPCGKPFLKDYPHIHFNLSHCPGAALCVVAGSPVGCDIEAVPAVLDMDVCRYVCSPSELASVLAAHSPQLAFTTLWTQKEARVKYTGKGLTADIKAIHPNCHSTVSPDGLFVYSICPGLYTKNCPGQ